MINVLGQPSQEFRSGWSRYDRYFGPNGEIIRTDPNFSDADPNADQGADTGADGNMGSDEEYIRSDNDDDSDYPTGNGGDPNEEDDPDFGEADESGSESPISDNPDVGYIPDPPLEALFMREKVGDIDNEEAKHIVALLKRTLQYNAQDRPSTTELLQDPWILSI